MPRRTTQRHATANTSHGTAASFIMVLCLLWISACSPGGAHLSGFGLGATRVVHVGEIVEIRMPLRDDGSRRWRVTSYDSRYLRVAEQPRVMQASDGSWEMVVRVLAHVPGETEVELTEIATRERAARAIRFTVKVLK